MKKFYIVCLLLFAFVQSHAQIVATTRDGRKVLLHEDGSWEYAGSNNFPPRTTDVFDMYSEAYQYAYEIIFAEEFYRPDRIEKANEWTRSYLAKNLRLPVGSKTLEEIYTDLYQLGCDSLYRNIIFTPDKKQAARRWAEQTIKDKAYFEDRRLSLFTRQRMAYDVAYNHIYEDEFFTPGREKKAARWAREFITR
jgi:hypothetical protein